MFKNDLGAEDYGPPAPSATQVAIQNTRDILTSQVPLTPNTLYIMVGASLAIYFAYQYMYSEA